MSKIPKIIKDVWFDFSWDERKVWDLNIEQTEIDIEDLIWHLELPFWSYGWNNYILTIIDVVENKEKYKEHYSRIINSNIDYPIDIMFNKWKWVILDWLHRLAKLRILWRKKIIVRKIWREFIENIKK